MGECVGLTLSQLFKLKGGYVRTNLEQFVLRVEMKVGSENLVFRTGADWQGFKTVESAFKAKLDGGDFTVDPVCGTSMGIDNAFMRRLCSSTKFSDKIKAMQDLYQEQRALYNSDGFIVDSKQIVGTPADYFNGVEDIDVISCPNETSKKRLAKFLDDDEGVWKGLEFHFKNEKEEPVVDYQKIVNAWVEANFVEDEKTNDNETTDWNDIVQSEQYEDADISDDMVKVFLGGWRSPITSKPEHEKEKIFWGGGKKPSSNRKQKELVGKCFPPDKVYPIKEFMRLVKKNLVEVWGYDDQKSDMEGVELNQLVIGQMLRARGQLNVHFGEKTVEYTPRPAAYVLSQQRGEKNE